MSQTKPAKLIHVLDDIQADAIAHGLYEDLENSNNQQFIGLSSEHAKNLASIYHLNLMEGQSYVYDNFSQSYILFDDEFEKRLCANKLEAYVTILGFMGATSVEGKFVELTKKARDTSCKVGATYKFVKLDVDVKRAMREDFSRIIEVKRTRKKTNNSYEEIKKYLSERGVMNDNILCNRLEELRTSSNQQLTGEYEHKLTLIHNLESVWELAANVSVTPIFKANTKLHERCQMYTEVHFELKVSFD